MNKKNLKLFVVPAIYAVAVAVLVTSVYLIGRVTNNTKFKSKEEVEYVDREIVTDNEYIPVIDIKPTIVKPFSVDTIEINKTFYNKDDEESNQENAIIFYENTYMQNSGVDYKNNEVFDIVSVLDGTIIEISENAILGKTIKVRHNNDLISTYGCLSEVNIKTDDYVLRGQVIGKSGTCSLYGKDNNLHFELAKQGKNIDPEQAYNKNEDEL